MLCKLKLTKICIQSLLWLLNDMLMRVLSIIFFLLVSLYSSFAQITLDTLVDTNLVFQCSDIALDQSGNVILAGKSTEYPSVLKYNSEGDLIWGYSYTDTLGGKGVIGRVYIDSNNQIYVLGCKDLYSYAQWVAKLDVNGHLIWFTDSLNGYFDNNPVRFGAITEKNGYLDVWSGDMSDTAWSIYKYQMNKSNGALLDEKKIFSTGEVDYFSPAIRSDNLMFFSGYRNTLDSSGVFKYDESTGDESYTFIGDSLPGYLFGKDDNHFFSFQNSSSNSAPFSTRPFLAVFTHDWVLESQVELFNDTIMNSPEFIRPNMKDAFFFSEEKGCVISGLYSFGNTSPYTVSSVLIQVNPYSGQVENRLTLNNDMTFSILTRDAESIYVLAKPGGYPNRVTLYRVNIPDLVTGVKYLKAKDNQIVLSPNPSNGLVNVFSSEPISHFNVYDISGKLVSKQNLSSQLMIYKPGIYFIDVYLKSGKHEVIKHIVID